MYTQISTIHREINPFFIQFIAPIRCVKKVQNFNCNCISLRYLANEFASKPTYEQVIGIALILNQLRFMLSCPSAINLASIKAVEIQKLLRSFSIYINIIFYIDITIINTVSTVSVSIHDKDPEMNICLKTICDHNG